MIERELAVGETVWWAHSQNYGARAIAVRIEAGHRASGRYSLVSAPDGGTHVADRAELFDYREDAERCAILRILGGP